MGEFASKGVAGSGLGLGIAGTALGVLNASANGNGGLLGGLFGNGNNPLQNQLAALMAENGMLKSENYADKVGKEVYSQSLADNRATEERINAILAPTAQAIAENQKEIAVLKMQIAKDQEINQLKIANAMAQANAKIDSVAQTATCGIQQNGAALANLQAVVNQITHLVIPQGAICPPVMPRYNSWTAPTDTTTTTTADA